MNETILLLLSNLLTGTAGWFVGRKKVNAETDNQVLRNLELSINVYKTIIDDLKREIQSLNSKVVILEQKIDELHKENQKLKSKKSANTNS